MRRTPAFPAGFDAKPAPFGVGFTGTACSEPRLIELAYAFEQATQEARAAAVDPLASFPGARAESVRDVLPQVFHPGVAHHRHDGRPGPSRSATRNAATTFAPVDVPAKTPSSCASRFVISTACSVETCSMPFGDVIAPEWDHESRADAIDLVSA